MLLTDRSDIYMQLRAQGFSSHLDDRSSDARALDGIVLDSVLVLC